MQNAKHAPEDKLTVVLMGDPQLGCRQSTTPVFSLSGHAELATGLTEYTASTGSQVFHAVSTTVE